MSLLAVLLAISPVLVIFVLLVAARLPADRAGLAGWVFTALLAGFVFHTSPAVILIVSLSGLLASLPISFVVATSIFQMTLMQKTGALDRIVVLLKTLARQDRAIQILIINVGAGTLLTALGAVPVSILPPIMLALGYSAFTAIALPAIGYDALCTYALLGTPVLVFAQFTDLPLRTVGVYFARFMPVITTLIALGMLWIAGRGRLVGQGVLPAVLTGLVAGFIAIGMNQAGLVTLTGIAAGAGVVVVMLAYARLRGVRLIDRSALGPPDRAAERRLSLARSFAPWILLIAACLVVNEPWFGIGRFLFDTLSMPVTLIPGRPERLRVLWQAYFWILVTSLLALPFLRASTRQVRETLAVWARRAPRPVLAAAIFFAIAYVINHSGKTAAWTLPVPTDNMVVLIAQASADALGRVYALIAPFLGLLAGFISGSESSAIAMLTKLHLATAGRIGASGLLIAAASGIGGGLASVISPAKLQNAAAAIDRIGMESEVIKVAVVVALIITLATAGLCLLWAF